MSHPPQYRAQIPRSDSQPGLGGNNWFTLSDLEARNRNGLDSVLQSFSPSELPQPIYHPDAPQLSFSSSDLPPPIYHPDAAPPHDQHPNPPPGVKLPPSLYHSQQSDLASENAHLRERTSQLEQQLEKTQEKAEKYIQRFFEARVGVMGFKCRQMQLQGEVECLRGKGNKPSETELQAQLEKMRTEKIVQDNEQKNHLAVIDTLQQDIQNLQGRRDQDHGELERLQQVVRELQQENTALKSQQQQPPSPRAEKQHLWVVRREEIHLTPRELGRGGWAVVQVAEFRGLAVAAKCLHHAIVSPYNRHLFVREMNIASSVRHPNLVQFIGATIEGQPIILTELMESCLRTVLERRPLNPAQITSISIDVARALNYLHLMHPDPIIHRDLSSANVLLDSLVSKGWRAKVADYGSVNYLRHLKTVGPGNPTYAAPEADVPKLQSPKMDVFSYGVLLLEMCSRKFPSPEEREGFLERVHQPAMVALIQQCLEHDPQRRPTMTQILEHLNRH